jgi:SAM-dependent methyltransferase
MPLSKFQCATCHAPLIGAVDTKVMCDRCDEPVLLADGIFSFAAIDAARWADDPADPSISYTNLKSVAADRWPRMLGSVLQVGSGPLTRAIIEGTEATDMVVTDASLAALHVARAQLQGAGLLDELPITFAAHGGTEDVFRDGAFDTCAGSALPQRASERRRFLAYIHRWLRPGGRAFFLCPNARYRRALGRTLADILLLLNRDDPRILDGNRPLLNLVGQWCHDPPHRDGTADGLETLGEEIGFAEASVLPVGFDPTGRAAIAVIADRFGVSDPLRSAIFGLLPAFAHRYLSLLRAADQSAQCLLWLEKGIGPVSRHFRAPQLAAPIGDLPQAFATGGLPPRWLLELTASRDRDGTAIHIGGWCVVNTDLRGVRVATGSARHTAPVRLPRPDVPAAIDPFGAYAAPHVLYCGLDETFYDPKGALDVRIDIELATGAVLTVHDSVTLTLNETLIVTQ